MALVNFVKHDWAVFEVGRTVAIRIGHLTSYRRTVNAMVFVTGDMVLCDVIQVMSTEQVEPVRRGLELSWLRRGDEPDQVRCYDSKAVLVHCIHENAEYGDPFSILCRGKLGPLLTGVSVYTDIAV